MVDLLKGRKKVDDMDEYQERYLDHQKRKTESLEHFEGTEKTHYNSLSQQMALSIMANRRSQRIFNLAPLSDNEMNWIYESIRIAPSSCNRQAVYVMDVNPEEAERYLVGGKSWINKANRVLLLFASKEAYKSPNEKQFMPFLDAGFVGQNIYLMAELLGKGCCFVNPNIREENKQAFVDTYGDDYFCGAIALGNYDVKAKQPPLRELSKVLRLEINRK